MEINTEFECYLVVNDEEIEVCVKAVGDLIERNYSKNYVDNVFINSIMDIETGDEVPFVLLDKVQRKELLDIAESWLSDGDNDYQEEF